MRTPRWARVLAVVACVAALSAGCGDDEDSSAVIEPSGDRGATNDSDTSGDDPGAADDGSTSDGDESSDGDDAEGGADPGPAANLPASAGPDPCELVSAAEVAQFAARSVGSPERETEVLCRWPVLEDGGWVRVGLIDSVRYAELLELGYVESASGVAHDTINGSVMGLVVLDGDVGVQVGTTLPVFVGGDKSPGYEAHLNLARAALARR